LSPEQLEAGYWRAYRDFYRWDSILRGSVAHDDLLGGLRHVAYASGWKKFERLWHAIIRARRLAAALPVLEAVLTGFGRLASGPPDSDAGARVRLGRVSPAANRPDASEAGLEQADLASRAAPPIPVLPAA
jgi:hypothetical protein